MKQKTEWLSCVQVASCQPPLTDAGNASVWAFVSLGTLLFSSSSNVNKPTLKNGCFSSNCMRRILKCRALCLSLSDVDKERLTQKESLVLSLIRKRKEGGREEMPQKQGTGWLQPAVQLCSLEFQSTGGVVGVSRVARAKRPFLSLTVENSCCDWSAHKFFLSSPPAFPLHF